MSFMEFSVKLIHFSEKSLKCINNNIKIPSPINETIILKLSNHSPKPIYLSILIHKSTIRE